MSKPKGRTLHQGTRIPYVSSLPWTGITTGKNALCTGCCWARRTRNSPEEIKFVSESCIVHGGHRHG